MKPMRFQDGLATLFERGCTATPMLLALAEIAGLSDRVEDLLKAAPGGKRRRKVRIGRLGQIWISKVTLFWGTLRQGDAREIDAATRTLVDRPSDSSLLEMAFAGLMEPLTLLGRSHLVVPLHAELIKHGIDITRAASLTLAEAGDWDHAIAILESAHYHDPDLSFGVSYQDQLWKHAYHQGLTESVLPRLAAIPFYRKVPHAKALRAWQLVAYQVRAGNRDARVPVIAAVEQQPGYSEAAATQIAAWANDPSQAEAVEELTSVLEPKTVRIDAVDAGQSFAFPRTAHELFKAKVRIAARNKDYAQTATLARSSSRVAFIPASSVVIEAFLEEGDWCGAAAIAAEHDPRDRPVIEGFDDDRLREYRSLQMALAAAAARAGDHDDARTFLGNCALTYLPDPKPDRDSIDLGKVTPWAATMLAGVAEGVIPRRFIALLLPLFPS
jgi:hypothetical protein